MASMVGTIERRKPLQSAVDAGRSAPALNATLKYR
jgi:hypothetical protein